MIENEKHLPKHFKKRMLMVKLLKVEIAKALKTGGLVTETHLEHTNRLVIQ